MNDDDLRALEVSRAGEARQILESTMWRDAIAHLESEMAAARKAAPVLATDLHTRLILIEQLWGKLLGYFENIAQTGQLASLQIQEQNRRFKLYQMGLNAFRQGGRV